MNSVQNTGLIFDVGAHTGEDSDFYLKLGYRVVAVEANPNLAADLRKRFRDSFADANYVVVDKAIAEAEGTVSFFVNRSRSQWGTADPEWAARNAKDGALSEEIAVECVRFGDLIEQYGCPHYLKIDIEGADMICVNALRTVTCRPKFISLESNKTSWSGLIKEFDALEALGYSKFKVRRQVRHKGRLFSGVDGSKVSYAFEVGASGPFGDDLPGRWLTRRQALRRYVPIFFLYKTIGDDTSISRLLGRIPHAGNALKFVVGWYDTHAMRV